MPVLLMALGAVLVAAAAAVALYPAIATYWGACRAQQQFTSARAVAGQYDPGEVDAAIAAAQAFNARIAGLGVDGAAVPYEDQLMQDATGVLCWIDVPKLGIVLPVYRDDGTDEVPPEGAEHVRNTSLPVGGTPSNTVITAHSGFHGGAHMAFNKLDQVEPGDEVVLWTLGRPFAYEVTGSEVVEPDDIGNRLSVKGPDELTLLTCRPIGTTAKRLFVHAVRSDHAPGETGASITVMITSEWFVVAVAVLAAGFAVATCLLLAKRARDRRRRMRGEDDGE